MRINFLGDSITQGGGASSHDHAYTALVCKRFGATENNFGVGGTRIAPQTDGQNDPYGEYFILRAEKMPTDADFTFVFGGTNDYGHGDATLRGFCDAFVALADYILRHFDKDKVCFVLPLPRYNQDSPLGEGNKKAPVAPLSEYVSAEKRILAKKGLAFLDLSDAFPVPVTNKGDGLTVDGLHPNDAGHAILADRLGAYLEKEGFVPCTT